MATNATTGDMMEGNEESKVRKCDLIEISASGGSAKEKDLDNKLFEFFNTQLNDYVSRFNHLTIETDSGYTMLRYRPGGEYIEHVDHGTKTNRALTAILGLNDDYEGGELHFWGGKYKMKIELVPQYSFPLHFFIPIEFVPLSLELVILL